MRVEVFGYYLYPAFFAVLIGVPTILFFIIKFIINFRNRKIFEKLNKITSWQKDNIIKIIDNKMKDTNSINKNVKVLKSLKKYITEEKYWELDTLFEIDNHAPIILTRLIFDEIKENILNQDGDSNIVVLLIHTLDFINGGPETEELESNWIGDDITNSKTNDEISDVEGRMINIILSSFNKVYSCFDPEINKISERIYIYQELKSLDSLDFDDCFDNIQSYMSIEELRPRTLRILSLCLLYNCEQIITLTSEGCLEDYNLYSFRSLACILDKQLYPEIIESIE